MAIKAWGPLFALLALAGVGIVGLFVEHPEPYNRGQPTIAQYKDSRRAELAATHTDNRNGKKGEQERSWIEGLFDKPTDTLLVVFNGLLVLFTGLLYSATPGLFGETAELRRIANEQRADLSRSIVAAEKAADAANKSAKVAEDALTVLEKPYVFIDRRIALSKSIVEIKDFKAQNADSLCHIGVEYFIINHGRTPAIIKNLTTTMLIVANIPEHRTITGTPEIPPP